MEQMTLFDIPATTVTANPHIIAPQQLTQEEPIFEMAANVERIRKSKEIVERVVVESIEVDRSVVPTWQVNFFDSAKRERLEWYQCEDEEEARKEVTKEYPNLLSIISVEESRYSIEEIRAMD
ncbi:hypothetical protein BK703_16660 [Bacillus thuringiensis serovar silo]|uniref:hypothetical protein n=1 Tax=Bacillus thuringiensis TaxID=1428 RepID=UPI000A3D28C1|nr:hypothetical protein [Bacillus thuringiensis]OTW55269.1 hypothetical protein BK703_16660 [Bacillus thuringiensis serovar silo]OTW74299.1 hypothetical protein BK700_01385 [Bacillus thuringiensis serovar toguchini]